MKTELQDTSHNTPQIGSFARRSYKIYLEHYKARNLKPALSMDEFLENYRTAQFLNNFVNQKSSIFNLKSVADYFRDATYLPF